MRFVVVGHRCHFAVPNDFKTTIGFNELVDKL